MAAAGTFGVVCIGTGRPGWIRTVVEPSDLGLRVDRTAGGLLVHWNHQSRPARKATGGTLNIHDGPYSRTLPLDAEQIATGSILYEQQTGDVTLELNVHSQSGFIAEESLRVLGPAATASDRPAPALNGKTALAALAPEPQTQDAPHTAKRSRSFVPAPWLNSVHGTEPTIPAAARIAEAPALLVQQADRDLAPAGLISSSYDLHLAPPFRGSATLASYIPPRVVREVEPDIHLLGLPSSPVAVEVQVSIDELGRVVKATAEKVSGKASSELTRAAVEAARKWLFEPALLHGKKIPSGHTILFEFQPSRR